VDGAAVNAIGARPASGPHLPLPDVSDAAPQLPQTGHPCIAQHFRGFNVGVRTERTERLMASCVLPDQS